MGKKPKNEEDAKLPRLRSTVAEAQAQLTQLLEKGIEVKAHKTRSPEELEAARGRKQEWTTVTTDWLKQLFEDESVAEDFNTWVGRVLPEYADFAMFVENFQDEMHQRLLKLHSIFQRVAETPQVGAQYAQAVEEANAAPESGQATYPHRISKPSKKAEAAGQKAGAPPAKVAKVAELAAVLNDG